MQLDKQGPLCAQQYLELMTIIPVGFTSACEWDKMGSFGALG
jgi:hypothetical protein